MLVVGMIGARTVNLGHIATEAGRGVLIASNYRRLQRFWLDATYLKVRLGGRIVPVAAIIAMAVDTDGRREIIGLRVGPSEAETFWTDLPHAA